MKTDLTMEMEKALYEYSGAGCAGIYGGFEVSLGDGYGQERVDYMTMDSKDEFRCYEIKSSMNDFASDAKLTFAGDYNYLFLPMELEERILVSEAVRDKFLRLKTEGVGILLYDGKTVLMATKAKKRPLTMAKRVELMHCMVRSLSRYCECEFDLLFKNKADLNAIMEKEKRIAAHKAREKERERFFNLLMDYLPQLSENYPQKFIKVIKEHLEQEDGENDTE